MSRITSLDKPTCKLLAREIVEALQVVADRHGLSVEAAGGTFDTTFYTARVKFTVQDEGAQRTEFARWCTLFDLTPDAYGKTFVVRGVTYTLVGFAVNRSRFPIVGRDETGRKVSFTRDALKAVRS